ncbi:MAG: beta-galactosidase trimerization domain-containing protein [Deltaproteobacteria bacterium]|nr:beta-galactosidase trimerization domain-containing protein [Deltaproteobacteria bacterium]
MSALAPAPCPAFLLGVNYWSRSGGPRMWEAPRFDVPRIRAELLQMAAVGLNTCRSFAFIPTFVGEQGVIDEASLERLSRFLDLCTDAGMATIPSFLVGHMSGENYNFPGQGDRSPYTDPELLEWQEALIAAVTRRCAGHPAVIAYLASNEMPYWGGRGAVPQVLAWACHIRAAVRAHDPDRPFGLGDGVMNLDGGQNGFDVPVLGPVVDFLGPHTYYSDADDYRQALNSEYCVRSLTYRRQPILFEEFGCSSTQVSEDNQALYYREVIHGCLSTGCAGALAWCFSDFDLEEAAPYSHHAFELGFGITRADGGEKPVCGELRAIRRLSDKLASPVETPPIRAAIIVPSYFNTQYPFCREDRARMRRVLLQAYTLCVKAGIEAELVPEREDFARYTLLLAPATQKLLAPTWGRILAHVEAGATFYWSYFGGDAPFHQGAWCQNFEALTGVRHQLRYGCFDLPDSELHIHGEGLSLHLSTRAGDSKPYPRAFLPVDPLGDNVTQVIARDAKGRPALTCARRGAGQVFFAAYPLEYYLAQLPRINEDDGSESLYKLLAQASGLVLPVIAESPLVQARVATCAGRPLLWLFNRSWREVACVVDAPTGTPLIGDAMPLKEGRHELSLSSKEVQVYQLAESPRT